MTHKNFNSLNSLNIDHKVVGICPTCGNRLSNPVCEHATPEERAIWTERDQDENFPYLNTHRKLVTMDEPNVEELTSVQYGQSDLDWHAEAEADAQDFRDVEFGSKQWFDDVEE